jgi:outer membrane protein OmpA-like peptidoglycan-associated protein
VPWHWAYFSTYLLFTLFFILPIAIFWGLDRIGAIHDSSLISALIVALTYQAIIDGKSETKSSALTSIFAPVLAWMNQVPQRLAVRAQADTEEFMTAVANTVGHDYRRLADLRLWVEGHTADIVTLQQRLQEFDAVNAEPAANPPGDFELRAWSKAKADRLLLFVEPTLLTKLELARRGFLPWKSFLRALIQIDRTMRWAVPTVALVGIAWLAGQYITGTTHSDVDRQGLFSNPKYYRLDRVMPRYYSWRYLKTGNTSSDVKRALRYLSMGLLTEIPVRRGAAAADPKQPGATPQPTAACTACARTDPQDTSTAYSSTITGILQRAELTLPLADDLLKEVFADRLDRDDLEVSCAAMRLLPPALRSRNVEVRSLLGKTLAESAAVLWDVSNQVNALPLSKIGPQAGTIEIETTVVAWTDYLSAHCTAPTPPQQAPNANPPPQPARAAADPPVTLPDVTFAFDSDRLLGDVAADLRAQVTDSAAIKGYTDSIGKPVYNLHLSRARAKSVERFLMKDGVDGDALTTEGFGAADPIVLNDTEEGRAKNRRVVIQIIHRP